MEPRYNKADARKLARPYAKAAFDIAAQKGAIADWENKLGLLADAVSAEDADGLLHNPRLRPDNIKAIMAPVLEKLEMNGEQKNLVNILIENQRLSLLGEIFNDFVARRKQAENIKDVTIISAFELSEIQVDKIKSALEKKYNVKTNATLKVDSSLIGGIRIIMGDLVIDRSVKGDLERMSKHLKKPQGPL